VENALASKGKFQNLKDESDIYVTMRDGVRIAVRVYRPDREGKVPALFAASAYLYENDLLPRSAQFTFLETGPIRWYVEKQGYALVHADVRGSGRSEGVYGFFDHNEQQDLYEIIEWIARQKWCNGNVGGIGQSYYCWSQWFMGILNPPGLKCIAPYDGAVDLYRGVAYHGGIACGFLPNWYQGLRMRNLYKAANLPTGKQLPLDISREMIERQTYERLGEIKVPVLSIGHWGKMGLHLRGNILGYEEAAAPKKLIVTGARNVTEAHLLFDEPEFHERFLLPFYDHYLKGKKNGYPTTPPVRLYVYGSEAYREENAWPLRSTRTTAFYLSGRKSGSVISINDGSLSTKAPPRNGGSTTYRYPDPEWRQGVVAWGPFGPDPVRRVLTFTTDPLADDLEVVGHVVLELYASSDQIDTHFIVKVSDQQPPDAEGLKRGRNPAFTTVTKGWLRAAHREKDEKRSTPYRPFYTHRDPQPIAPGEVYRFEIEVMPCAYLFRKGHRIRIEIANGDSTLTDSVFNHPYHAYQVGRDTVYHSARHPSRLLLPVVPRRQRGI
jgi:uncharacterized protein